MLVDQPNSHVPAERDGDLLAALRALPPAQRAAIALRYVDDDLPVRAVADALGKSRRATESLLARGLRSLRATTPRGGLDV